MHSKQECVYLFLFKCIQTKNVYIYFCLNAFKTRICILSFSLNVFKTKKIDTSLFFKCTKNQNTTTSFCAFKTRWSILNSCSNALKTRMLRHIIGCYAQTYLWRNSHTKSGLLMKSTCNIYKYPAFQLYYPLPSKFPLLLRLVYPLSIYIPSFSPEASIWAQEGWEWGVEKAPQWGTS